MFVEGRLVADDALLVLDTATDALEKNAWQTLLRESLEIADAECILEAHGPFPVVCERKTAQQANGTIPRAEVLGVVDRPASHVRCNPPMQRFLIRVST
jgi:hypothetical protein